MSATNPSKPAETPLVRARVLVVDDQAIGARALEAALEGLQVDTSCASSGEQALGYLLNGDFAVVLLDVRMPGMDGFETAQAIRSRARTSDLPLIFVTGFEPSTEENLRAYALGAVDFITKPVNPEVLRAKVGVFVALYNASREAVEARSRYESLAKLSPVGVFRTDESGDCLYVNSRWCEISGLSPAEAVGRGWTKSLHAEDREWVSKEWYQAAREGKPYRSEYRFTHPGGQHTWVLGQARAERVDGRVLGYVGTITDITERKHAEEVLRTARAELERRVEERTRDLAAELVERKRAQGDLVSAQEQLRLVTDTAPALISYLGPDGRYLYANRGLQDWFGEPADRVRGKHLREVLGDAAFERIHPYVERALKGERVEYEAEVPYRVGGTRHVHAYYAPHISASGDVLGFVALVTDVTERRKREEGTRFLGEASVILSSSLDYEQTLRTTAGLAVPRMADWCAVFITEGGAEARYVALVHRDPAKVKSVDALIEQYPAHADASYGYRKVIRTGESDFLPEIPDRLLKQAARTPEHLELLRSLAIHSSLCVPITLRGETLGAISMATAESGRRFTKEDLAVAEELGRRAAYAVTNARQYEKAQQEIVRRVRAEDAFRDSEQRERARAQELEALMESVPAVVWLAHDPECRQITGNRESYEILRMPSGTNASKSAPRGESPVHFRVLQGGRELSPEELPIQRAARGEEVRDCTLDLAFDDGEVVNLLGSAVPLRKPDGASRGALAAFVDITRRRRAEEALQQFAHDLERKVEERTADLREAMRELDAFAYTVAHDLRGPIRAMTGFSSLLLAESGDRLDDEGRGYLSRILKGGERLDVMIRDLLDYSRLTRQQVVVEEVDLGSVIRATIAELAQEMKERNAQVEIIEPLPRVTAHPLTLKLALGNLLSNATKFIAPGTVPRIRVRAETCDERIRLWIEDNGIGIAPEHHDRIFGVFERIETKAVYPGTGIGLAIVRKAIERMGGRAGVESTLGDGSRFFLDLPLVE